MLMRYAQHLAAGQGLTWNIGEAPVDGATDFFYTVILACVARLAASLEQAVLIVDFVAHGLTVLIVYVSVRYVLLCGRFTASVPAAFVAFGPAFAYISAYFGTPVFACFSSLAWKDRGYVLATTEAGILPFYSGWRAIYTWGLNDQWIAHNGGVTPAYLDRYAPTLIAIHDAPYSDPAWKAVVKTMREYATSHGYSRVASFGLQTRRYT